MSWSRGPSPRSSAPNLHLKGRVFIIRLILYEGKMAVQFTTYQDQGFPYENLWSQPSIVTAPRGLETYELTSPLMCRFYAGDLVPRKGINAALGYVEGLQILAGETRRDALKTVAPKTFNEGYFDGVNVEYGELIYDQLEEWQKEISQDRRVVFYLNEPDTLPEDRRCAHTVQLRIVNEKLQVHVGMRSWDLVRGVPYNIMMWGLAAQGWSHILGVHDLPLVHIYATVPHLYSADMARDMHLSGKAPARFNLTLPVGTISTLENLRDWAVEQLDYAPWDLSEYSNYGRFPEGVFYGSEIPAD